MTEPTCKDCGADKFAAGAKANSLRYESPEVYRCFPSCEDNADIPPPTRKIHRA